MIKILWLSDRVIGGVSAYSKVSLEVLTRLAELGYSVAHVPMGRVNQMGKWVYRNILIYPSGEDPFAEDVALKYYVDFKADILVWFKDIWVMRHLHKHSINMVPYVPIDHSPVSPSITSKLHTAFFVLTPSRHGQRELMQAGLEPDIIYLPHGVDTEKFRYVPPEEKKKFKRHWFLDEDDFTVLLIARNQSRKLISRQLRVYKRFLELNPDVKSHLYLWTSVKPYRMPFETYTGVADVGVNLLPEIMNLGLGDYVIWPDEELVKEGIPDVGGRWNLHSLYAAADVLLGLTGGEGFFMPGLEAESVGVPILVTGYASAPEICGSGYVVPYSDYVIMNTPGTRYALVDIDKGAEALTKILNSDWGKLSRKARRFAERFDWRRIISNYWIPFLDECEKELYPYITKNKVGSWA